MTDEPASPLSIPAFKLGPKFSKAEPGRAMAVFKPSPGMPAAKPVSGPHYAPSVGAPRGASTYQGAFDLGSDAGATAPSGDETAPPFAAAVGVCVRWLERLCQTDLGDAARSGRSFDHAPSGQAGCAALADPVRGRWTARLTLPPGVATAVTTIDLALWPAELSGSRAVRFSYRATTHRHGASHSDPVASAILQPLLRELAGGPGLRDLRPLGPRPWIISGPTELPRLLAFVEDPLRRLPVFVVTERNGRPSGPDHPPFFEPDAAALANRCVGLAHVVGLTRDATWAWSKLVEKEWGAYDGAVRTYNPGLDRRVDSLSRHPLVQRATVENWYPGEPNSGQSGPEGFADRLVGNALDAAASGSLPAELDPSFPSARALAARPVAPTAPTGSPVVAPPVPPASAAPKAAPGPAVIVPAHTAPAPDVDVPVRFGSSAELEALEQRNGEAEARLEQMARDLAEYRQMADEYAAAAEQLEEENDQLQERLTEFRSEILRLTGHWPGDAESDTGAELPADAEWPGEPLAALADVAAWSARNLGDRIMLHSRAIAGAESSRYEDPELVGRALWLLANDYRVMRLGSAETDESKRVAEQKRLKQSFDVRLQKLGMAESGSISASRAGEEGEKYNIVVDGERFFLRMHWKKGTSRDESKCLRLYFCWCDRRKVAIVGSMTKHLPTRIS